MRALAGGRARAVSATGIHRRGLARQVRLTAGACKAMALATHSDPVHLEAYGDDEPGLAHLAKGDDVSKMDGWEAARYRTGQVASKTQDAMQWTGPMLSRALLAAGMLTALWIVVRDCSRAQRLSVGVVVGVVVGVRLSVSVYPSSACGVSVCLVSGVCLARCVVDIA
jgi:hypothetical protein